MAEWEATVEKYSPLVWRISWRMLGNEADAADCYQETFLSALRFARREPVRQWGGLLRRLAMSRALDMLRRRVREREHFDNEPGAEAVDGSAGPGELAEGGELVVRLRAALGRLPADQAEVFSLYTLEGQSYREIASLLGLKRTTVGVLLHRARRELRRWLSEGEEWSGSRFNDERSQEHTR